MAFTTITTAEIAVGEPTKNTTWTKVKDNFDDLDSRVDALSLDSAQAPIIMRVNGNSGLLTLPYTGFLKTTISFDLTITNIYLYIDQAGGSGTTEVDILFKRGAGAWTSVLTTKPSVAYTAGNDAISSNAVLNGSYTSLLAGDLIRMDITSSQVSCRNFYVRIDFTKG